MGVVFTGLFAFGLVLFSRTPSDLHLDHILVGNILGITRVASLANSRPGWCGARRDAGSAPRSAADLLRSRDRPG